MRASTPGDATGEEKQRHICCTMTSVLLRTVRTLEGEGGVSRVLKHAATVHDAAFLENADNWISLDEAVALIEAGVHVTGDSQLARRVGDGGCAARRDPGRDAAAFARFTRGRAARDHDDRWKFSTVTDMEAVETGPSHAVVRSRVRDGFERHPLMCDWAKGLLSQPCVLFGLPPARVEETDARRAAVRSADTWCRGTENWPRPRRILSSASRRSRPRLSRCRTDWRARTRPRATSSPG